MDWCLLGEAVNEVRNVEHATEPLMVVVSDNHCGRLAILPMASCFGLFTLWEETARWTESIRSLFEYALSHTETQRHT